MFWEILGETIMTTETKFDRKWLMAAYKALGKNFMTPRVLAKRVLVGKKTIVELSSGRGLFGGTTYGVSVLRFTEDGKRAILEADPSRSFDSLESAKRHYQNCL